MKERLWHVGFMAAILAAFWLGSGLAQEPSTPKVIRAQKFELVDAQGKTRAVLAIVENGHPRLRLYDENGKVVGKALIVADELAAGNVVNPPVAQKVELKAVGVGWHRDEYGFVSLRGFVHNDTGKPLARVTVDVNFYTPEGIQVQQGYASMGDLAENGIWQFDILVLEDKRISSFKVLRVLGE